MDRSKRVVLKTASNIKALRIQGASKICAAVVETLRKSVELSNAKDVEQFRKEVKENMLILATARPTEPETRAALRTIHQVLQKKLTLEKLKQSVVQACTAYEHNREKSLKKILRFSFRELHKCETIFTHCHSNTVESILKMLYEKGKLKHVICTETRPRFQGRITARNLSMAGIPCTMIVDSAARAFIKDSDAFLTGCDAILASGAIVNKIGTSMISLAAKRAGVPHYVASSSLCFDPETYYGKEEKIEERDPKEVWGKKPRGVEIRNPAFDVTEAELVHALICEKGVFSPKEFVGVMVKELGLDEKPYVSIIDMLQGQKMHNEFFYF